MRTYIFIAAATLFLACADNADSAKTTGGGKIKTAADCTSENTTIFYEGKPQGLLENDEVNEASGLAASAVNEGIFYTHNDSGGEPAIYALDEQGRAVAIIELQGGSNRDWEDMCVGPSLWNDGRSYIYAGEIGDNNGVHPYIELYCFPESEIKAGKQVRVSEWKTVKLKFPDGAKDAEALFIHPQTKDIYIISKRELRSRLFRASYKKGAGTLTLTHVGTFPFNFVTSADISPDGGQLAIRTYDKIYWWSVRKDETLEKAIENPATCIKTVEETQGEAVTFSRDGKALYTISEETGGAEARLIKYVKK